MTNSEKLKEVFGENFSIASHPVGPNNEYKTYGIITDGIEAVRIEKWLDREYEPCQE